MKKTAHIRLVAALKRYRENRIEMRSMARGFPELLEKYQREIDDLDTLIAEVEGGSDES